MDTNSILSAAPSATPSSPSQSKTSTEKLRIITYTSGLIFVIILFLAAPLFLCWRRRETARRSIVAYAMQDARRDAERRLRREERKKNYEKMRRPRLWDLHLVGATPDTLDWEDVMPICVLKNIASQTTPTALQVEVAILMPSQEKPTVDNDGLKELSIGVHVHPCYSNECTKLLDT